MPEYVDIAVRAAGRTVHAVRLKLDSTGEVIWVPRTCIADAGESVDDALMSGKLLPNITVQIAEWKVNSEGWE